jgi:superfamily II DNA or RNA helicase
MKIIKRSGLAISREYETKDFYRSIKSSLDRKTKAYNTSVLSSDQFFLESEKYLLIPRNFPIHKYTLDVEIEDRRHEGAQIEIQHKITPRSETQKNAIRYLMENESCILQLLPGVGKTVISIYMIAERKKKAMILVHRDSLADQWKQRVEHFTNLTSDNIARLTSETFEEDLKKPIIIVTAQTFLSLLKRKRLEFLTALNAANVGVFIADEVHTSVGAPTFSECSIHVPSKYTYGLSATPYRYDGNGDIIEFHLGKIFTDDDAEGTMPANVTVVLLDYNIDIPSRYTYIRWGGEFQRSRYLNLMKKSIPFNSVLMGLLNKFIPDRDILCMMERIKLIEQTFKDINCDSKSMFCGPNGLETLKYKLTLATPGKARDGIDAPHKDCIIMTSPISNIEQLAGRVTRIKEGKKDPIIVDMVDIGCRDIARTSLNRIKFYEKKNWKTKYILVYNNKLRMIEGDLAKRLIQGEVYEDQD